MVLMGALAVVLASPLPVELTQTKSTSAADEANAPPEIAKIFRSGALGIRHSPMVDELAEALGVAAGEGDFVEWVVHDGPAAIAGIKPGDIIAGVDGSRLDQTHTFSDVLRKSHPGQRMEIDLLRNGERLRVVAVTGEFQISTADQYHISDQGVPAVTAQLPGDMAMPEVALQESLGAVGLTMRREYAFQLNGVPLDTKGVILSRVLPSSVLDQANLMRGDIILSINFVPVESLGDLQRAIAVLNKAGHREVLLRVLRRLQHPAFIPVRLP